MNSKGSMSRSGKTNSKSINLSDTAYRDDKFEDAGEEDEAKSDEDGDEEEEERKERDLFENAGRRERSLLSTWKDAGIKKDKVLNTLITKFAMLVHKKNSQEMEEYIEERYNTSNFLVEDVPVDALYSKLPNASNALIKIIKALEDNDSSETRDFTIFIAHKQWVQAAIRPMLELCALDQDVISVQYCRKLLFWLLKDLSEASKKALHFDPFKPGKEFKNKEAAEGDSEENAKEAKEKPKIAPRNSRRKDSELMEIYKLRKANALDQYRALISFKESLCSEQAIKAIVVLFGKMWQAEIAIKEEYAATGNINIPNNKLVDASRQSYISVNSCLICVCRLLEIDVIPAHSNASQIKNFNRVHQQLIVYLRAVLMALPGIFAELYADVRSGVRYFDSWLSYIFKILRNALRGFQASELFQIWQMGGLLSSAQQDFSADSVVPVPSQFQESQNATNQKDKANSIKGGMLKSHLAQEKHARSVSLGFKGGNTTIDSRHSRFGGIFVRPIQQDSVSQADTADSADPTSDLSPDQQRINNSLSSRPTAYVRRGVQIAASTQVLPTGKAKASKKSVAFSNDAMHNTQDNTDVFDRSGQEACVVLASVADLLCESKGLNELIKRVNEDLRRDEGVFYDDMELVYFEILSKMLAYNRLKLLTGKAEFETRVMLPDGNTTHEPAAEGLPTGDLQPKGWVPDLRNMIEATSNMSENRIVRSMDDLIKKKQTHDLYKPIECFKEIICYIRIELESANLGHRDLAAAALFRIFYTQTTDRRDPLPKLLADWRASTYTKRHTHCLVELLHETMKTLDLARTIYSDEVEIAKARKIRRKKGSSMDIEQYTAAAYRFDADEYFRKLVSNGSVRLYTRLLENFASNNPTTNHYVYRFFHRLNNFHLDQPFPTPSPLEVKSRDGAIAYVPAPLSLGHMLFNVQTMTAFSVLLNGPIAPNNKTLDLLIRLGKSVVRRFGEAAQKNHMLFVECLFQHSNPTKHACERIDSVYEAQAYKPGTDNYLNREDQERKSNSRSEDVMSGSDSGSDDENNREQKGDANFLASGSDDEFDENDANAAAQPKNIKRILADRKKKELEKIERKEARRAKRKAEKAAGVFADVSSVLKNDRSRAWLKEEDAILSEVYAKYVGAKSIFQIIAADESLVALGKSRTVAAVQKRCKELDLHMKMSMDDDDDDVDVDRETSVARLEGSSVVTAVREDFTQSQRVSQNVDALDLDEYEAVAIKSTKKRKIITKLSGADSDEDEDFFKDTSSAQPLNTKSFKGRIIDSDEDM